MTRDDIITLGKQAGFTNGDFASSTDLIVHFGMLVAAHEREACAKVCDAYLLTSDPGPLRARRLTGKQSLQVEPVAHSIVAGALFDLMGWLTSRKERLVLSSADEALPAVEVIIQFAAMRDLSLDDPKVLEWQTLLNKPALEEPTRAEKMREAGYTRRPSLREFPSEKEKNSA